jgi:hypothetical protein
MLFPMEGETLQSVYRSPEVGKTKRRKHNKYAKKQKSKKHRGQNRHHLLNRCQGGSMANENLVWLKIEEHHQNWHQLFNNSDPEHVILLLDRLMTMKGYKRFRGVHVTQEELA